LAGEQPKETRFTNPTNEKSWYLQTIFSEASLRPGQKNSRTS
jgi:hypothetical protein